MLDTKVTKAGSILIHDGRVNVQGFSAEDTGCREIAVHALIWAIGKLQQELVETIASPGGGNVCIDFPPDVCKALGIDPWE